MCDLSLDLHYDRQATGKIIRHRQNRWRFEEARGMARIAALFLSVALPLTLCRELSPNVFTTVFDMDERQLRPPLAVLRVNRPAGGATHPANINILDEDPHWALKVEEFVVAAGVDTGGVKNALNRVRDVAWGAGRTFQARHVVLLTSAEDAESDSIDDPSSTLTKAVLAAARHTTDAHFTLVADGFKIGIPTKELLKATLREEGWRGLTIIELPEFEGYSSAINRALKTIPKNSIVAVLSTSILLLRATTSTLATATSKVDAENLAGYGGDTDSGGAPDNVFVAYERIQSSPGMRGDDTAHVWGQNSNHGKVGGKDSSAAKFRGLLVTSSALRVKAERHNPDDLNGYQHRDGVDAEILVEGEGDGSANKLPATNRRIETARVQETKEAAVDPPLSTLRQQQGTLSLSDVAPIPLLLFDVETFFILGELDEGFTFQGGVAEWMTRAHPRSGGENIADATVPPCSRQRHLIEDRDDPPRLLGARRIVRHVHEREWDNWFLRSKPPNHNGNSHVSAGSVATAHVRPAVPTYDANISAEPGTFPPGDSSVNQGAGRVWRGGTEKIESQRQHNTESSTQPNDDNKMLEQETKIDRWSSLPSGRLHALVQADVDLFYLPLLLSLPLDAQDENPTSLTSCVEFHWDWMGRGPDDLLVKEALTRRERMPVAAVVVVHDDISLMRANLEEVAAVVEHIIVLVSVEPWNGNARDVSPTLELLENITGDVRSPVYGKIQVEVGTWRSEEEQREHGNALIRADPRSFARVMVIDTDEFWHPVELTKALILAARHPRAGYFRAQMATYWASIRSVVSPAEDLRPLWLVDPHRCRWHRNREIECVVQTGEGHPGFDISPSVGVIHHLSYVRTREGLRRKMGTFSHAGEEQNGWYERSWLGWEADNSLTDLHPTVPEAFKRVVRQPLFQLTPAVRSLHLDARKGKDSVSTKPDCASTTMPTLTSIAGITQNGVAGAEIGEVQPSIGEDHRGACAGGGNEDTLGCEGDCESRTRKGCEETSAKEWTDRQRTMCLVPDQDNGTLQLRRLQYASGIMAPA